MAETVVEEEMWIKRREGRARNGRSALLIVVVIRATEGFAEGFLDLWDRCRVMASRRSLIFRETVMGGLKGVRTV